MKVSLAHLIPALLFLALAPIATGETPAGLQALAKAYPGAFQIGEDHSLVWPDGTKMPYGGPKRSADTPFEELLNTASIEEQMMQQYPVGPDSYGEPAVNFDPGRIRNEAFFLKMYGGSAAEVRENLRTITWLPNLAPQKLAVTTVNGVDKKLEAVSADLEKLQKKFHAFMTPSAGTFNWRKIAGTDRLSNHSFGSAIDLNINKSNYWKWDKTPKYRNQIPREIVEIFEKHGFIWGGKWYHYDTMHFEYRPELLLPGKAIKAGPSKEEDDEKKNEE